MTQQEFEQKIRAKETESLLKLIDSIAKTAARTRRVLELEGGTEKFDQGLNEALGRWERHYASMDKDDIMLETILER